MPFMLEVALLMGDPGLYALVLHNWTLTSTIGAEVLKSRIVASGGMPDSIILVRTVGVSAH
jgi:hypothetical protein